MTREVSAIMEFMDDLDEPQIGWPKWAFDKASYSRWAASEILELLENNPSVPAEILINQFIKKMDRFLEINPRTHNIFYIALTFANDVADVLRAMS